MHESLINHLFLPHHLPSSAENDFLIQSTHRNEYLLLKCMEEYLTSIISTDATSSLPVLGILTNCIQRWSALQNPSNMSVSNLQNAIHELPSEHFLPIYFRAQNAAILIEMNSEQPLISAWQVLLPSAEITSSFMPHLSCFPVTTYKLNNRSQLISKAHCELLMDFMDNTIEYSKSIKSGRALDETRDIPESNYVCQWWVQHFHGITIDTNSNAIISFKKKHRDHIRWNRALLPFRRSGLWMAMKVVFQTILTKRLGNIVGKVIYKLLITGFLTHIICIKPTSTDILVHCLRKIVRRLNKIEGLLSSIDLNDKNTWIERMKQDIELKINQQIPESDWQTSIQINEEKNSKLSINSFKFDDSKIYQHLCLKLKAYLNKQNSSGPCAFVAHANNYDDSDQVNQNDYIPSIQLLTEKFNYTIDIALNRIEIWIESCLDQWINRRTALETDFQLLLSFFEKYQSAALNHYYLEKNPIDPIGYSRFILASLTIIRSMHQKLCSQPRFTRLTLHSIHIPNLMNLFEFLVFPNREDMIRSRELYDYFHQFSDKLYPDLLTDIEHTNAFGVYFANQTPTMIDNIGRIRAQAEQDKQEKIREVNNAKEKYQQLMNRANRLSCEYKDSFHWSYVCPRCQLVQEAENIKVKIFECPIPVRHESALAVIFELQIPIQILCYRDILWQFINRLNPNSTNNMYQWLNVPPHNDKLGPYYTGPSNRKVNLVSSVKSMTQTHYSNPPSISSRPVKDFLFENSLKVEISPTNPMQFKDECRILTPQIDHPTYKNLQFTIDSTQFMQNQVIAKLSDCPPKLKPTQFVEYGSFRSGHCLQWWNLLVIFETDSLSIAEESVAILITHSILQSGPIIDNSPALLSPWCPESHREILEDHFVDELVSRLNHHLDDCELNWQNELVLTVITTTAMRILTICNEKKEKQVADLVLKCRRTGEKWIDLITKSIQTVSSAAFNEVSKLRLKMVHIGISCLLTFSTHQDRIDCLLSSNEHIISLLKASSTIYDNIILNKDRSTISTYMKNMMRFSTRVSIMVQPTVAEILQKTSCQSLNEFARIYWAVIKTKGGMNGGWKKRKKDNYDGWYDCQYESKYLSIDCIKGKFLVDNMTIGFLPETITSNELFVRVFGSYIFEVQVAESPNTYVTKYPYHDKVHYEFHFNHKTNHLTINERNLQTKEIFQLIPHSCFKNELPDTFFSDYSHWWNITNQTIDFRPIRFEQSNFLDNKPYKLSIVTGQLTTTRETSTQILVNQSSTLFQILFNRYFTRLDDKPYIYMLCEKTSPVDIIIHIHLSRLKIAFQYNARNNIITSREYSDMRVQEDQWVGTLTGLTSGLLLSPIFANNQSLEHYPCRKLIVPFGQILSAKVDTNHQTVTIHRSTSNKFSHEYFVFIMDDRLKILQSTDSPTGWLYLALLHAMTSHPLPDKYTGMVGMERAFQILNLAGCYSDQPFDELSLDILGQIASISPKVNYYPPHLTCMEQIDWNCNGLPHSMQHFGYYLLAKRLMDASQKFNFMYSSLIPNKTPEIFQGKMSDEILLKKLYWDYRDSCNPTARLSTEMEAVILKSTSSTLYQLTMKNSLHVTNYSAVSVNDLYNNGSVSLIDCSEQHWLPLSGWLSKGTELKSIWIGLLKMTDSAKTLSIGGNRDAIEQMEKLIDFLYYISDKLQIKPYYLQILKTALKMPNILSIFVTFPPFIGYSNIEETAVVKEKIDFVIESDLTPLKKRKVIAEIKDCLEDNCDFEDNNDLLTSDEITDINKLLKNWKKNKRLRSFLEAVQNLICSIEIEQFHTRVSYSPQEFDVELIEDHHQIQLKSTKESISRKLLSNAERIFRHPYSGHFNKPILSVPTSSRQNQFPNQIFSSSDNQNDSLKEISNYFKNQLDGSWKKLLSEKLNRKEDPTIEEITELLNFLRTESTQSWNELVKSFTELNEQLFETGLISRITSTIVISLFQQKLPILKLTPDQYTLLGGIIVYWTLEQQLERARYFLTHKKLEDFNKEISNIPHSNWTPSEHISWLILELEMNITIRETQIRVAQHMMQPNITENDPTAVKSIVMQMNMGEGKTSVILPMLAVSLSISNYSLIRIVVLKSLFPVNYQSLRYKLGGLINRRIFPFACRRDMNFSKQEINQISNRLAQGLRNGDVILTSPEDILSFDLLTIDKCRRNEFDTGRSMLTVQRWLKAYVRDVLDESDEILHVKYQLIYTVGAQQQLDAGAQRWQTIQNILQLVKKHAEEISTQFNKEICYKPSERKSAFPQFRLQSPRPFPTLCKIIADDWIKTRNYRHADRETILSFILETNLTVENLIGKFPLNDIHLFLIIRGLLSSEVLLVAFKKRYRVNYGVNRNPVFNRLMAVPFRAKDVVADRTEFGHPDVALVLTQLSYFYSGLNDEQLIQCFNRLSEEEADPASIYDQWIFYEEDNIPTNIKQWKGVNLKDYQQKTQYLFPTLRHNILVINYFLNHFVYPREAKQFPYKLVSSAWDLSSSARSKIITGFSGTNDTQLLLPVHIRQYDLPELQKTDAIVVNNLLQSENEHYQSLPINATSEEILNQIINYKESINVILDVGALFIDGTNKEIAVMWLNLSDKNKIDYAVYFDSDLIVVCDRQFHHRRFETSPASERLDHCVFYLDEIHTRGTDFKFPKDFRAAVTLGNGLTKDRFVQAAMRMRKLGNGHSLTFWSSHEVHQQIIELKRQSALQTRQNRINVIDLLRWVYENTVQSTWDGLHHCASQSLSFQRKVAAFRQINWNDRGQVFTDIMMIELARECLEPEIIDLTRMYGAAKVQQTLFHIHTARYEQINYHLSTEIQEAVLKRLLDYGGTKQRLSQLLDEEQQRELEQELEEERQLARPPPVKPCEPILHEEIKKLCDLNSNMLDLNQLTEVFRPIPYAFTDTTFANDCQPNSWYRNLWISTEFQRVIATKGESLNSFLRPPRWIVFYRMQHIILISAHEANWLIRHLKLKKLPITTLRLLLPRIKLNQSVFVNTSTLTIPPSIATLNGSNAYFIPISRLVQLFIFNGTLFFGTTDEQTAYCQCLSLCPKPRSDAEEKFFEMNWIAVDGFVEKSQHRCHLKLHQAQFISNPMMFVKHLVENRNNSHASISSHVGSIILNSTKLLQ